MTRPHIQDYRWRTVTPERAHAVREAWKAGVRAADLAQQYGVTIRTIYRYVHRAGEPWQTVSVFDYKATFVKGDDGEPVRMTWVPA